MAYYEWPNKRLHLPQGFEWGIRSNVELETSPTAGPTQPIVFLGDRWVGSMNFPKHSKAERSELDGYFQRLRGQLHGFELWHLKKPQPLGTMRGSPTLIGTHVLGSTVLQIQTNAGSTLLAGDMIGMGVGGQLEMVSVGGTANGTGVLWVTVNVPLRADVAGGTLIVWDRPKCKVVSQTAEIMIPWAPGEYGPGKTQPEFGFAFMELFA